MQSFPIAAMNPSLKQATAGPKAEFNSVVMFCHEISGFLMIITRTKLSSSGEIWEISRYQIQVPGSN